MSSVNWSSVNKELSKTLLTENLGVLAQAELKAPAPLTPKEWLRRLALLVRADYRQETLKFLDHRPVFLDAKTEWYLSNAVSEASTYEDLPLAKRLSELFPEVNAGGWFEKWAKTVTEKEADSWLEAKGETGNKTWFYARVARGAKSGTEAPLLASAIQEVKAHPEDGERLEEYLRVAASADIVPKSSPYHQGTRNTEWLADVIKLRYAVENYVFGTRFDLPLKVRQTLLERSLAQPYTPEDGKRYSAWGMKHPRTFRRHGVSISEKHLRYWTKEALMNVYEQSKQPKLVQKLFAELVREGSKDYSYQFIGEVGSRIQKERNAHIIEVALQRTDAEKETSADYWLKRGQHHAAKKEDTEAIKAFEKALSLTPISQVSQKEKLAQRIEIVETYSNYLYAKNYEHPQAAYDFLHSQLEISVKEGKLADEIARSMMHHVLQHKIYLSPEDPVIWAYLEARPEWVYSDLIRYIVESRPMGDRGIPVERLQNLLSGGTVSRPLALARVAQETGESYLAVRCYRLALKSLSREYGDRNTVLGELWTIYKKTGDLEGMKDIFQEFQVDNLWRTNFAPAFLELANAVQAGNQLADKLEAFKNWLNQDRRVVPGPYPFTGSDFLDEIRPFYYEIEVREPQCDLSTWIWKAIGR